MAASPLYFATCPAGTEDSLVAELTRLEVAPVAPQRGGVAFGSRLEDAYRTCLWSRVASRILLPLARFEAVDAATLYDAALAVDWCDHLGPDRTLAVLVAGNRSPIGPAHFIALKTKDAIVDRIRTAEGARPSIDKLHPDVRVHVHTHDATVTVSLDLGGSGLHLRGLGRAGIDAPLRENLAAAILYRSGWPERADTAPLFDPMCGSATLLLEGAAIARDIAPGLDRGRMGVEGWRGHDPGLWQRLVAEANQRRVAGKQRPLRIAGSDAAPQAVQAARALIGRLGLGDAIRIEQGELADVQPPWSDPGVVVLNPPYGERLGEVGELGPLYELIGDVLKRRFPGWTAWILSGNRALDKRIGLRTASKHELFNGPIPCRLLEIPIRAEPVTTGDGPGWRKSSGEAQGLRRRLEANLKTLVPWANRQNLTAYRIYDADIPTYNVAIDRYGEALRIEENARPNRIDPAAAEARLEDARRVVAELFAVAPASISLRVRRKLTRDEQHHQRAATGKRHEVQEGDLRFLVNLDDYLDTGLYLDDRLIRRWLRDRADGQDVLNLFAYTCTGSVAAARGGARSTTSIDLSNGYLAWGRDNFVRNDLDGPQHQFIRADATALAEDAYRDSAWNRDRRRYGLIFLAPPSRSRSKGMPSDFDIQRDHVALIRGAANRLTPTGSLLFTTNLRVFELDPAALHDLDVHEITRKITPRDFASRPRLRAWAIQGGG